MKRVKTDIQDFLNEHTGMTLAPTRDNSTVLRGTFSFSAQASRGEVVVGSYDLEIIIPHCFPRKLPTVTEYTQPLFRKIPKDDHHHVNNDGTLCLGSPIRLFQRIAEEPTISGFANNCLVPYLYAVTLKIERGGTFVFNELDHGQEGIIADYLDIFGVEHPEQVLETLKLLGMKKRIANKRKCPCNCGQRLGKCDFRNMINQLRTLTTRAWFRGHAKNPGAG